MAGARLILILAASGLAAVSILPIRTSTGAGAQGQPAVQMQPAVEGIQAKGRLVPKQWTSLSFPANGKIAEIPVREGDQVSAGSPLARLDDLRKHEARVAAAELELLVAQQALDTLHRRAGVELALAGQRLAEMRKAQETAYWKAKSTKRPVPSRTIQQANANLLLLEKELDRARKDLRRAEKLWKDRESPIWWFVPRHAFKLNLVQMQARIAQLEGKYNDRLDGYNDLKIPADEIDLQQAEADLAAADARVEQAIRDQEALRAGPDPDDLALAQSRLRTAQEALRAAQAASADLELNAAFDGQVVAVPAKAGEWIRRGEPVMILADLSAWDVEIQDIEEGEVPSLQEGQAVQVTLDALPGEDLSGRVETISLINGEKDGDVTYTVKIALEEHDPRFRWGMTARVQTGR